MSRLNVIETLSRLNLSQKTSTMIESSLVSENGHGLWFGSELSRVPFRGPVVR